MKGKIAVITGCHWCPYKANDSSIGLFEGRDMSSSVHYCGYHKIGFDGTQLDLEKIINWEKYIYDFRPTEQEQGYPQMPEERPLPEGEDGRDWPYTQKNLE